MFDSPDMTVPSYWPPAARPEGRAARVIRAIDQFQRARRDLQTALSCSDTFLTPYDQLWARFEPHLELLIDRDIAAHAALVSALLDFGVEPGRGGVRRAGLLVSLTSRDEAPPEVVVVALAEILELD